MTQVAEGDHWELITEPGEEEYNDRYILRLSTDQGIIEVKSFVVSDSRNWASWHIEKQYNMLKEKATTVNRTYSR